MPSWNPLAPIRQSPPDTELNYRTHINKPDSIYDVFEPRNMVCQLKLYHWSRSLEFRRFVPIGDLRDYLLWNRPNITKRHLGMTAVQTVPYKFRTLKGVCSDNDHAVMCYTWNDPLELQYGLEWMLSMWVWKYETSREELSALPKEEWPKVTEKVFEELGSCEEADLDSLFIAPLLEDDMYDQSPLTKQSWPTLWAKHGWEDEERMRLAPKPRGLRSFD